MKPQGLSADSRDQLGRLLRASPPIITSTEAATALGVAPIIAARKLAAWARAGWLARVRRGAYVPVPIEAESADIALDDPWAAAAAMYSPCYIGGWSAAEHWGLTEQIFSSLCVMTTKRPRNRQPLLRKSRFELHTVPTARFIGLKNVWRGSTRVQVSDPARTVIDMLSDPALGGGIRHVTEMLATLLREQPKEAPKLADYAAKLGVGAIYKRLGFLLQRDHSDQTALIEACRENLSTGYARLDPALPADRLVTVWRIWVPAGEWREARP
jgi:predicted transcriptional regulator of viral defense system